MNDNDMKDGLILLAFLLTLSFLIGVAAGLALA